LFIAASKLLRSHRNDDFVNGLDRELGALMLHLVNGGSTALVMKNAHVPGIIESADEILMEGPARNRLAQQHDWVFRAERLETYLEFPRDEYMGGVQRRTELLEQALQQDEVVLWFEEDLFCQVNYMQLLSWLAGHAAKLERFTYVCPPTERLGELSPARLDQLFAERKPVTASLTQLADRAWSAYTQEDPFELQSLIDNDDFTAWPALRDGLRAHLARLPDASAGVNRIEHTLLSAIQRGASNFDAIFVALCEQLPEYGVPDGTVVRYLVDLAAAPALVTIATGNSAVTIAVESAREWSFDLTPLGRAVLTGEDDYAKHANFDRWLGGVHLSGKAAWRWNSELRQVVTATP
jgi:hypothetical protein